MNAVRVFLWCERCRFSLNEQPDTPVKKTEVSEIKFIYSYLHVFRMADMLALIGLTNKDIEVR